MGKDSRPLPDGWYSEYDTEHETYYYVDANAEPPRTIWHHPLDDEQYRATQKPSPQPQSPQQPKRSTPSSPSAPTAPTDHKHHFGRSIHNKVSGTTYAERQQNKALRAEEERRQQDQQRKMQAAYRQAAETGKPVYMGKDKQGHDVYLEPPEAGAPDKPGNNPYNEAPYTDPNARFIKPKNNQNGGGYGGGCGPYCGGPYCTCMCYPFVPIMPFPFFCPPVMII